MMLYLHDVWVNWFEGEENGYNVCEFHEWRRGEDMIELLDQVPLLYIETPLFSIIENDMTELPQTLLDDIHQRAFLRKNHERVAMDYCCVLTDGKSILAIDTMGYSIPLRKSRVIPKQEQLIFEMIAENEPGTYEYTGNKSAKEYHILSPEPAIMRGLTRKERQLKQLLFMALDQLYNARNTAEVRYWYTEWCPQNYSSIQAMDFDTAWHRLYEESQMGWSDKHQTLCENMIKGQPFFEKLWDMEYDSKVN